MANNFKIKPSMIESSGSLRYGTQLYTEMMRRIADISYTLLVDVVNKSLNTTKGEYLSNLSFKQVSKNQYVFSITGNAAFLEEGYDSFDMKPGFLQGAQISDAGTRYRIIPLNLGPNAALASEDVKTGTDNMLAIRSQVLRQFKNSSGLVSTSGATNTANIPFGGLGASKRDAMLKSASSTNIKFRTVSENSSQDSWIHPGFGGVHAFDFLDSVLDEIIEDAADQVLDQTFDQFF